MKKIFGIILVITILFSSTALAIVGDVSGQYYATDIKTYLNGAEIDSINIGGQTLISAEAMRDYGFFVNWDAQERTLSVDEKIVTDPILPNFTQVQKAPTGTPIGYYYETDIITYLDNAPITAYNTGGKTYIHAEAMRDFGYTVNWHPEKRELDIISPVRGGYVYDITLSKGEAKSSEGEGYFSVKWKKDGTDFTGDADYLNLFLHSTGKGYNFTIAFYQNEGLFYSTELQKTLRELCYDGFGIDNPVDKSEKYDLVNQIVTISINGKKASKVSVTGGAGNGHRDFYFFVEDIPPAKEDEIYEIIFSVVKK